MAGNARPMAAAQTPEPSQRVPHVETCPGCGGGLEGRSCKVYCTNSACELYGRIIENCAGD